MAANYRYTAPSVARMLSEVSKAVVQGHSPMHLPKLPEAYIAPSFLWASVVGHIDFVDVSVAHCADGGQLKQTFKIKHISCTSKSEDSLGELTAGNLQISALWCSAVMINVFEEPLPANCFIKSANKDAKCLWATLQCNHDGKHYIFHPDSLDLSMKNLVCVQLFADRPSGSCSGLVLSEVADGRYRRVGLITSLKARCFLSARRRFHIQ